MLVVKYLNLFQSIPWWKLEDRLLLVRFFISSNPITSENWVVLIESLVFSDCILCLKARGSWKSFQWKQTRKHTIFTGIGCSSNTEEIKIERLEVKIEGLEGASSQTQGHLCLPFTPLLPSILKKKGWCLEVNLNTAVLHPRRERIWKEEKQIREEEEGHSFH